MTPQDYLEQGAKFPYDATDDESDEGTLPPAKDWAHIATRGVMANLTDRRGNGFEDIDDETRIEIVETLAAIIRAAAEKGKT